ncbi:MAG: M2 family metallopeptidase [Deltaproteobacteria bacterium]|nr:M2 family metallopeptidase [Deltaproteobacteria bacterium]
MASTGSPTAQGGDADGAAVDVEAARQFIRQVEEDLHRLTAAEERAAWVEHNFITMDTQEIAAEAAEALMQYLARTIKEATRFDGLDLPPELARKFHLLKLAGSLPAPSDPTKTAELARATSEMKGAYGKGKYCPEQGGALRRELAKDEDQREALKCQPGPGGSGGVSVGALGKVMAKSRNEAVLREAWIGWRTMAPPLRKPFSRYVALGNEGAREIGFKDVGDLWRSGYDMSPEDFRADVERLMTQVRPFYQELHCYVRKQLQKEYGKELVKTGAPIPAHLLGNMWSQSWTGVYPLVEPYPGQGTPDLTPVLKRQKYTEKRMVKLAEGFFVSLGLDPLPETFWERSLFVKPRDREVMCHASAWDVHYADDLRIKMCIDVTEEELGVLHHELGHNYYYHYYHQLPILFERGANDGFHEAIGDVIALSVTPGYLKQVGLLRQVRNNDQADLNYLMKMALDKVAFLPFGKLIDQWRWDVFAGKIPAQSYNRSWWDLRRRYQGIVPPVKRTEASFDPAAKYHVAANVPYMRYFLSTIYQFQFHRAWCRVAGHRGPLHRCSIYRSKAAGDKLKALLQSGASRPWQEVFAAATGERRGDAGALLEYYQPLRAWLRGQTKGETCGW